MSSRFGRNGCQQLRHLRRITGAAFCFSVLLIGLAAFTPVTTSPTVWVVQDATAAMRCTAQTISDANTLYAVTTAWQPCRAGTLMNLVATTKSAAMATHRAYVMTPDGAAAQALLHPSRSPVVGKHPASICLASALCGGGGGGGSSPCEQQVQWISFNTGNVAIQGWYSTYGTSDCRAFEVYSEGLEQTWGRPLWWPFSWHMVWDSDNGTPMYSIKIPTSYYLTRAPYYWVGTGGSQEEMYENNGFVTHYFSVQFTPR